ncbi:MAG: type II secretion system F family protein [Chloroflexales bacterium]|nr:type II secretion system F family protein [Chloroflexales bacterium]
MADRVRRVVAIAEVTGMEGETIALRELFRFEAAERDAQGRIGGRFAATGHSPAFLGQLHGYVLPQPGGATEARPLNPAFEGQLAEMTALTAALLRAGYSFVQTLGILAQELPEPLGSMLGAVSLEIGVGRPIGEALDEMARRARSPALQLVIGAIVRQRSEGGNLADGLDSLVTRLRQATSDDPAIDVVSERIRAQYGLPPRAL